MLAPCIASVTVGDAAHFGFLNAAFERAAGTKCKFDGVGHTVVPGDLEVQLEYALVFHDRHLLVQHLDVRNRPVRKVQLAPESAVFCRCQRVVSVLIAKLLGQGLILWRLVPLVEHILLSLREYALGSKYAEAEELSTHSHGIEHGFPFPKAEKGRVRR